MSFTRRILLIAGLLSATLPGCLSAEEAGYETAEQAVRVVEPKTFDDFDVNGRVNPPWKNGVLLAKVCEISDATKSQRKKTLTDLGLKELAFADGTRDSQAVVAANDEVIVVAAPGTHSFRDGIRDLQVSTTRAWPGIDVHNGFYINEQAVEDEVVEALRKARRSDAVAHRPERKIWLTGHSQGGATIILLAYSLRVKGYPITGVMTFGSPKSGANGFFKAYHEMPVNAAEAAKTSGNIRTLSDVTHRWLNERDPVPSLPPRNAFQHVGKQHFIEWRDDRILFYDNVTNDRDYNIIIWGFRNHGIADYIDYINDIMLN